MTVALAAKSDVARFRSLRLLLALALFQACRSSDEATSQTQMSTSALISDHVVPAPFVATGVSLSTKGDPKVTDAGTFEYRIPIAVPDGVRGVQPSLAIVEDSAGGTGLLGRKWAVSGLSVIRRCQKTMAEDRVTAPVNLAGDEFCLDGERLLRVSGSPNGAGEFRTRRNPYAKIATTFTNLINGIQGFQIFQPDGRIFYYGRNVLSRLVYSGPSSSPVVAYYLDKIQDRFGNAIAISYSAQTFTGPELNELVPTSIQWGGAGTVPHQRSVQFNYVQGTMSGDGFHTQWMAGVGIRNGQRLQSLFITGPDGDGNTGVLRSYNFGYTAPTISNEQLLTTIKECDANGACKAPTTITWEAGSTQYTRTDLTREKGVSDVAIAGASADDANMYRRILVADLNRDGRDDIVYRAMVPASTGANDTCLGYRARLAQPDGGFGPSIVLPLGPYPDRRCTDANTTWRPFQGDIVLADVNRDGYPDILSPAGRLDSTFAHGNYAGQWSYGVYLNAALPGNTVGFGGRIDFEESQLVQSNDGYWCEWYAGSVAGWNPVIAVGDIDGDGYPEILRPNYAPNALCDDHPPTLGITAIDLLQAGGGAGAVSVTTKLHPGILEAGTSSGFNVVGLTALDGDGDGAAEMLYDSGGSSASIVSRTMSSQVPLPSANPPPTGPMPSGGVQATRWLLDLNGDGLKDSAVVYASDVSTIVTNISTGKGFGPAHATTLPATQALGGGWLSGFENGGRVVDYNLDGRQDLVIETPWSYRNLDGSIALSRTTQIVLLSDGAGGFTVMDRGPGFNLPLGDPADGPRSTTVPTSGPRGYRTSVTLDVNGDGLPDFLQFEGGALQLYTRQGNLPDFVTTIIEGTGRRIATSYAPPTDSSVYSADNAACAADVDHLSCFVGGQWLAKSLQVSGCDNDIFQTQTFTYTGGVFDRGGLGFLGFEARHIYGPGSNHVMKRFHNTLRSPTGANAALGVGGFFPAAYTYPEAFRPNLIMSQAYESGTFHETDQSYLYTFTVQDPTSASSTFTFMPQSVSTDVYVCAGTADGCTDDPSLLTSKQETTAYDGFGNLTSHITNTYDAGHALVQQDKQVMTYTPDPTATWLVRLLAQKIEVSTTASPAEGMTRTTNYTPDLTKPVLTGLPTGEIATMELEPKGDTSTHLLRTFHRDDRGRLTSVSDADFPDANECGPIASAACGSICASSCSGAGPNTGTCIQSCMPNCVNSQTPICESTPHTSARTTGYAYEDADGVHVTTTTDAAGHTARVWRHPGFGFIVQSNDANGATTSFTYDTLGRQLAETKPTGESTSTSYADPAASPALCGAQWTITPENKATRAVQVRVNAFGNETQRSYSVSGTSSITQDTYYDANGRHSYSQTWSSGTAIPISYESLTYDDLDRLVSDCHGGSDAANSCKTNAYNGLTTTVTNEAGRVTTHFADVLGRDRIVRAALPGGTSDATFTYGPFGLLRQERTTDGTGQTDLLYDNLGRQTSISRTGAGTRGTTYNAFGDIVGSYKLAGDGSHAESLSYGRDALGRLTSITGPGVARNYYWDAPASAPTVPAPNAKGKLVDVSNGSTLVHFDYFANGLPQKKTWSASVWGPLTELTSAQYEYDPQGRPSKITYPKLGSWSNPLVLTYGYDPYLGDASSITDASSPNSPLWSVTGRGPRGEVRTEAMGTPIGNPFYRNTDYYKATGLVQTGYLSSSDASDQSTLIDFSYQYDAAGLASSYSEFGNGITGVRTWSFGYDNLGRLTRWGTGSQVGVNYSYDTDGNMTERQWSSSGGAGDLQYKVVANADGGYTRTVSFAGNAGAPYTDSYRADPWGRITDTPAISLTYDAADEVTAITEKSNNQADAFYHDGFGGRLVTTYGNPFDGRPWSQLFTYDDLAEVRNGSAGKEERCRVRANGKLIGELVRTTDTPTRAATFYLTDRVGSVIAEGIGYVEPRVPRDPFGNLVPNLQLPDIPRDPATANDGAGRMGFGDHPRDDNWGLVDMQARFYSPRLGRFIEPDPLLANPLDRRSFNAFAYVRNNPVAGTDPRGMDGPEDDSGQNMSVDAAVLACSADDAAAASSNAGPLRRRAAPGFEADTGSASTGDDGTTGNSQPGTVPATMTNAVASYDPSTYARTAGQSAAGPSSAGSDAMSTVGDSSTYNVTFGAPPIEINSSYDFLPDMLKRHADNLYGQPLQLSTRAPYLTGSTLAVGYGSALQTFVGWSGNISFLIDTKGGVGLALSVPWPDGAGPYTKVGAAGGACAGPFIMGGVGDILDRQGVTRSYTLDLGPVGGSLSPTTLTLQGPGPGVCVGLSVESTNTFVLPLLRPGY
jgi:RHS repeat-associated protein